MESLKAKFVIRPCRSTEIDRIYDIECESFSHPWPRSVFRRLHHGNPQGFLVAERNGEVIGYGIVEISMKRGHLLNLAVASRFRQKGVGTALAKALIRYLQNRSIENVWLEVRASNDIAKKFYSKLGFKEIDRKIFYYRNEDAVVMNLTLRS